VCPGTHTGAALELHSLLVVTSLVLATCATSTAPGGFSDGSLLLAGAADPGRSKMPADATAEQRIILEKKPPTALPMIAPPKGVGGAVVQSPRRLKWTVSQLFHFRIRRQPARRALPAEVEIRRGRPP
jgi:hypothetical protein